MTRVIVRIEVPSTACTVLAEYLHDGPITKVMVTVLCGICRSKGLMRSVDVENQRPLVFIKCKKTAEKQEHARSWNLQLQKLRTKRHLKYNGCRDNQVLLGKE